MNLGSHESQHESVKVLVTQSCLTVTPWTVACQEPLSKWFSRQEIWSELPFSSPGDLPNPGIQSGSSAWQTDSLPSDCWLSYCCTIPLCFPIQAFSCFLLDSMYSSLLKLPTLFPFAEITEAIKRKYSPPTPCTYLPTSIPKINIFPVLWMGCLCGY